jgi:hypothetical protein
MKWPTRLAATIGMVVAVAAIAVADQWNDRTMLKFDAPMMIPGATLAPGTYVFKLLDTAVNRQVVQVFSEDGTRLIATTNAIPTKRTEPNGEVVVKLNPTEAGAPAALKAWFYPGSLYGHEFVYPEAQARDIARRTKKLVLSEDIAGSDMKAGTLHTYDAEGRRDDWRPDEPMQKDWERWSQEGRRTASARIAAPGSSESRESTAPMMRSHADGMTVSLAQLEERPQQYVGQTISVTAEVESVLGPRLFKIDEPNWGDLDGEILVSLPAGMAGLVKENDRVTVTGTMKTFMKTELERELAWLEPDPDVEVEFARKPVLVASQVVGGNSDVALAINVGAPGDAPVGTSGTTAAPEGSPSGGTSASGAAVTNAATLGKGADELVGRKVDLDRVTVTRVAAANGGFWIQAGDGGSIFVLLRDTDGQRRIETGQPVSIDGVVLQMPRSIRDKTRVAKDANDEIYVYATSLT